MRTIRKIKFILPFVFFVWFRFSLIYFIVLLFFCSFVRCSFAQQIVWSTFIDSIASFSSPRATDLNGDGILDIVIGAGTEAKGNYYNATAFNGVDGSVLWHSYLRDESYTSAIFQDVTGDSVPDIFIGGRGADYRALDGTNGNVIWRFLPEGDTIIPANLGWYNFYTGQFIPDQNSDGFKEILQANGGDGTKLPSDTVRPPGCLMILNSKTGDTIVKASMPDGKETYCSPLIVDFLGDGNYSVIYGSGGETIHGSLWKVSLADLLNRNLSNSIPLVTSATKGFIAPPSLVDLNKDTVLDIVVASFDGNLIAVDGKNNSELWKINIPNGETYSSPAIGNFTGDNTPDVFVNFGIGVYPTYSKWVQLMVDGVNGQIKWQDSIGIYQLMSPVAFDYNGDGWDEVLFTDNRMNFKASHDILLLDFFNNNKIHLLDSVPGASIVSTPWVGDIDNDDTLDLICLYTPDTTQIWVIDKGFVIERINLGVEIPKRISWGAYLGTNYDGIYSTNIASGISDVQMGKYADVQIVPNPFSDKVEFRIANCKLQIVNCELRIYDVLGKEVYQSEILNSHFAIYPNLPQGIYFYKITGSQKQTARGKLVKQ